MTDLGGAPSSPDDGQKMIEPAEESLFRLVAGLVEDLQKVRLAHGNRIRTALPRIPETIKPPRGVPTWEALFKQSSEAFEDEEQRLVKLGKALLEADDVGRWLLRQQGLGPALALRILGRVHPLTQFRRVRGLYAYAGLDVTVDKAGHAVGVNKRHPRLVTTVKEDGTSATAGVYKWDWRLKVSLYLFGQSLLKSKGPWRDLYDARKVLEQAKLGISVGAQTTLGDQDKDEPDDLADGGHDAFEVPPAGDSTEAAHSTPDGQSTSEPSAGDAHSSGDGQATPEPPVKGLKAKAHHRALRYVQKRLLRDLWRVGHGEVAVIDGGAEWPHGDPFQAVR